MMVEINDEWIIMCIGIKERCIFKGENQGIFVMGIEVVNGFLEKINIVFEEVELVICVIVIVDMLFFDIVNLVVDVVGMKNVFCFDVNVVCLGFLYVLIVGVQFIVSGMYKKVIVIGVDKMLLIIDYIDCVICIIFGDGAGVVMFEFDIFGNGIIDYVYKSDGFGVEFLYFKVGGFCKFVSVEMVMVCEYFVFQNGCLVFKVVVFGMSDVVKQVMECNELVIDDICWLVLY